jgi:hypothetical protein
MESEQAIETDVLIIGLGFSAVPLLRELDRSGVSYLILSTTGGTGSIWDRLGRKDRLDFDLVSSTHSSLYSFELVNRPVKDTYPTAKEYAAFIRQYQDAYVAKIQDEWVTLVENFESHSVVRTRSGKRYRAKHVVISTAFKRKVIEYLEKFDFDAAENRTVVLTAIGDSANLIISKLVPRNARVIVVSNGFLLLDKLVALGPDNGRNTATLDQGEFHNVRHLSNHLYRAMIGPGAHVGMAFDLPLVDRLLKVLPPLHALASALVEWQQRSNFFVAHPAARRDWNKQFANFRQKGAFPNGVIAIKYWPLESYRHCFGGEKLAENISKGYLLNDLCFFVDQGLVELWRAGDTAIDREQKTLKRGRQVVPYDYIIDGDREEPNLPPIVIKRDRAEDRHYTYVYRDNYLGVVPKELSNVLLLGYTRPTTGGLGNIVETQCLLAHKLITDEAFNREIYRTLEARIRKYDAQYYPSPTKSKTDHLVFYGFYNEEIAEVIGINTRLRDCRSLRGVMMYYFYPNNIIKFRQRGAYAVEGAKELVDKIWNTHRFLFYGLLSSITGMVFDIAALLAAAAALFVHAQLSLYLLFVLVPLLVVVIPLVRSVHFSSLLIHIPYGVVYVAAAVAAIVTGKLYILAAALPLKWLLIYMARKWGPDRAVFNDMKIRRGKQATAFFAKYLEAFRKVHKSTDAASPRASARTAEEVV